MELFGTALTAVAAIAVWDLLRMLVQTWWLSRQLKKNPPNGTCKYCPSCGKKHED